MSNEPIPVLRTGRRVHAPSLVVLVLGGGKDVSRARSRPWHLAGLRMWPFTWMLRRVGRAHDISVQQLQYRFRGWNAPLEAPSKMPAGRSIAFVPSTPTFTWWSSVIRWVAAPPLP